MIKIRVEILPVRRVAKITSIGSFFMLNLWGAGNGEKWFLGKKAYTQKAVLDLELMVIQS